MKELRLPKIAALTAARNDTFFLTRWIRYYGRILGGSEHLYILLDGTEQLPPPNVASAHVRNIEHLALSRSEGELRRLTLLSQWAQELFAAGYDVVLGCDADEYLVPDPALHLTLPQLIAPYWQKYPALSALGLDMGQRLGSEPPLQENQSILAQRAYGVLSGRYSKPALMCRPNLTWGRGFHRIKGHNYHILPGLYLIHLGYCDEGILHQRLGDRSRNPAWQKHIHKQGRTIRYATHRKPLPGDRFLPLARRLQTFCRPPYAWNKPIMPCRGILIQLPERFRQIDL